jgi:phosphoglycolate phosphatase-like HAD superfamily hydrolase
LLERVKHVILDFDGVFRHRPQNQIFNYLKAGLIAAGVNAQTVNLLDFKRVIALSAHPHFLNNPLNLVRTLVCICKSGANAAGINAGLDRVSAALASGKQKRIEAFYAQLEPPLEETAVRAHAIYEGHAHSTAAVEEMEAISGSITALDRLLANGFTVGIATGSPAESIQKWFARIGREDLLGRVFLVAGGEKGMWQKPYPQPHLTMLAKMGGSTNAAYSVGDHGLSDNAAVRRANALLRAGYRAAKPDTRSEVTVQKGLITPVGVCTGLGTPRDHLGRASYLFYDLASFVDWLLLDEAERKKHAFTRVKRTLVSPKAVELI